jgi:hypothetical protein
VLIVSHFHREGVVPKERQRQVKGRQNKTHDGNDD